MPSPAAPESDTAFEEAFISAALTAGARVDTAPGVGVGVGVDLDAGATAVAACKASAAVTAEGEEVASTWLAANTTEPETALDAGALVEALRIAWVMVDVMAESVDVGSAIDAA